MKNTLISLIASLAFIVPLSGAAQCNVNMAVLPVSQGENVPAGSEDYLLTRLTQLVSADGITSDPGMSQFFITAKFNHITEDVVPGPPEQTAIHTHLTLYVGDILSETVYSTATVELRGVGTSRQRAFINAMRSINARNSVLKNCIDKGRKKITDYYDSHYPDIIAKAKRAAAQNDYRQALWHLVSVPECCKGYQQVRVLENEYFQTFIDNEGTALYNAALAAWSTRHDQAGAQEAFGYLLRIDPESAAYPAALRLVSEMNESIKNDRDFDLRSKYADAVDLEKNRIEAIRQIGVAYGKGQQPSTTNLMWLK
ncbi:MAG: hypothetical protein K2O12_07325 [Muribaculaceae bacterium]|nr:hypothetical protein [Muribaculaceae bacterium]